MTPEALQKRRDAASVYADQLQMVLLEAPPDVIGGALADIMARYLQRHQHNPPDQLKDDQMRRNLFEMWAEHVWGLVAIIDSNERTRQ